MKLLIFGLLWQLGRYIPLLFVFNRKYPKGQFLKCFHDIHFC